MSDMMALGRIAPGQLSNARLQLHYAAQLIAAFGQEFVPARADSSHRSMVWGPHLMGFASGWGKVSNQSIRLMVSPVGLRVSVWSLDVGREWMGRSLFGLTFEESFEWVEAAIARVDEGLRGVVLDRPAYAMPNHPVGDGAAFQSQEAEALDELSYWYASAASALDRIVIEEPHAGPVRCWPHHFDMATLMLLDPERGAEEGRSVGVGFSPGDDDRPQPHWYVNVFPRPEDPELAELPDGAYWNTEGWLGAVLPGDTIVAAGDAQAQNHRLRTFLQAAVQAARAML